MGDENKVMWWYNRAYLYIFVSLFIYVILSVFIAVIMDTYETIKVRQFMFCILTY
jgi:mucolipin 3